MRPALIGCVVAAVWVGSGIAFLLLSEAQPKDKHTPETTLGDAFLMVVFGAPFLPLMLLSWLCQLPLSCLRPSSGRKAKPKPDYVSKAEAEVDGWLQR